MSINRTIATVSAIAITAVGLVACNDSEDKMDNKMDSSMTPSSAMMSEEKMDNKMDGSMEPSSEMMEPSSAMMEPSSAMMSEEKMTEESK
ncbi:hypothetical protein QP980_10780 [Corynebacterium coyleae]|uniref:hypothetical protein n=1 Tax=Corynebacterium coyleae TaxID=53374 RepID=UPI00254E4CEA|nr:hypothetical protein [Corynebacterium coyleae]MDK8824341.1 hypothetical protein [Corynebacterium coyleae]